MTITHNIAKTAALGLLLPVLASAEGSVGVSLVVPDNLRLTHEETLSYEQTSIPVGILQGGQVPTKKSVRTNTQTQLDVQRQCDNHRSIHGNVAEPAR
jgi:hypothetical protein